MTDIPDDIRAEARKAIYDDGRGMIGRNRSHLEGRVARALLSERRKQIERDAKIAEARALHHADHCEASCKCSDGWHVAAAIRAQQEPK